MIKLIELISDLFWLLVRIVMFGAIALFVGLIVLIVMRAV